MMTSIEPEWRWKSLSERLAFAYTNQLFTDIDITVFFYRDEYRYKAHKCILAHYSPRLEKELYGDPTKDTRNIELTGIEPEGLSYILRYLYHVPLDSHKAADTSLILSAYHTAQVLNMTSISTQFREDIFANLLTPSLIRNDNFWKLLELACILKLKDVMQELLVFAQKFTADVLKAKSFVKASASTVKRVLNLDTLNVTEVDVLNAIAHWRRENASTPFADDFTRDLMTCVRFRNLTADDFVSFATENSHFISREDILKIIIYLSKPSTKLPNWCSKKFRISSNFKDNRKSKKVTFAEIPLPTHEQPLSLLNLFTSQKSGDVIFKVMAESDMIFIKAHRTILAIGSLVFERMFFGPLADTRYSIEVAVFRPEGFRTMIRYCYEDSDLDSLLTNNPDLSLGTLDAALKYGSNSLRTNCLSYTFHKRHTFNAFKNTVLKTSANSQQIPVGTKVDVTLVHPIKKKENAIINENLPDPIVAELHQESPGNSDRSRLEMGNASSESMNPTLFLEQLENVTKQKGSVNDIGKKLLNYATKYTKEVLKSRDLLCVSRDTLVRFLSLDLTVQEIELLNRVAEWIEQKPSLDKTEYEVLGRIRFDSLTPQEFCSFLSKHEHVLPCKDSLAILRYLVDQSSELPGWCCKGLARKNKVVSQSEKS